MNAENPVRDLEYWVKISRNVQDKYKTWDNEAIKAELLANSLPYSVLMSHVQGDFNISTVFRNINAFRGREMFYFGRKKIDRRGMVGCQNYGSITYLPTLEDVKELKERFTFVALEQTVNSVDLYGFDFTKKGEVLLVVGEEGSGICQEILDLCDYSVVIPMGGSVRSLNVGTAAGIAMSLIMQQFNNMERK